jgi:hypothetical protein
MFSRIFYIFTVSLPVLMYFLSMHVCTISYFLLFIMHCAVKTTIFFAFLNKKTTISCEGTQTWSTVLDSKYFQSLSNKKWNSAIRLDYSVHSATAHNVLLYVLVAFQGLRYPFTFYVQIGVHLMALLLLLLLVLIYWQMIPRCFIKPRRLWK